MSEAWNRGDRDASSRTPLHGGEHAGHSNATYDQAANGWVAQVAEQNRNEQPGAWAVEVLMDGIRSHVFPTAAACLGDAVTSIVTLVDREA
jgi:hypothetical protein